jgi:kinesin family protein 18/19
LGIPEIIIDNFLLAMKIFRIALTNIQDLLQSLETQQFYDRCNGTTIVVEIKAEVAPNQDVREGVNVSRLRLVKMLSVDD